MSSFYQPARQSFSSSQNMQQPQGGSGFGGYGGGQGFGGGFGGGQGYGGGQGFGGFGSFGGNQGYGGGQGFGGFDGGFGGFQPQQQFNPFQGGFGGGMQQGYNPMFGGLGGLGFNPMMGQGFGMPMQGFNPYQQQQQQFSPYQQQQNPFEAQDAELTSQMQSAPEYQAFENARKSWEGSEGYKGYQQKRQDIARQMQESQGYNPPMDMRYRGGPEVSRQAELQQSLARQQEKMAAQQPQSPFTGPQRSAQDILSMAVGNTPQDMQYDMNKDGKITSADALAYTRQYGQQQQQQQQQPSNDPNRPPSGNLTPPQSPYSPPTSSDGKWVFSSGQWYPNSTVSILQPQSLDAFRNTAVQAQQQPMYGGLGSLGFNPMMGQQFGMPMTADQKYQQAQQFGNQAYLYANSPAGRMAAARYEMG